MISLKNVLSKIVAKISDEPGFNNAILPFQCMEGSSYDLNSCNYFGIYVTYNCTNAPIAGWVTVLTIPYGTADRYGNPYYCRQLAFKIQSNKVYSRYCDNKTWSSWTTLHS